MEIPGRVGCARIVIKVICNRDIFAPHVEAEQQEGPPVIIRIRVYDVGVIWQDFGIKDLGFQIYIIDVDEVAIREVEPATYLKKRAVFSSAT